MPRQEGTARQYLDLGLPQVCRRLADALHRKGWTKADLGRQAGISDTATAKLLDPQSFGEPQLATMVAVARALGLTLDGLFGRPAGAARIPAGTEPIAWIVAQRGIARRRLAADAGLSPQTLSNVAGGKSRDFLTAVALAHAGGVSLDSLAAALSAPAAAAPSRPIATPAAPASGQSAAPASCWEPIALSGTHRKAMDRVGGAELILPWPPGLPPGPPVADVRDPTPAEKAAAEAIVGPACAAAGLVPVRTTVARLKRPTLRLRPLATEPHLVVLIIGRRWVHASTRRQPAQCWYAAAVLLRPIEREPAPS